MTYVGLAVLASLSLLVGRLAARVARVGWLDRFHPDVLPLQAALGTGLLTSLTATASHAGLGQRRAHGHATGAKDVLRRLLDEILLRIEELDRLDT